MYQKILIALENGRADETLLPHVRQLAELLHSQILLLHVADGWVARNYERLKLAESEEMKADREYLEKMAAGLRAAGLTVSVELGLGDPPAEIIRIAEQEHCDLIAMATHGHGLLADIVHGSTIAQVRHRTSVPVLLVRAAAK
ncbi:MAG: universal stress protein [Limisphaerales bacterium]